jgi:hypothetical protein
MKHPAMRLALRGGAAAIGLLCAVPSSAYEYRLAFTPIGNYKDLVVAGHQISGGAVIGDCSYTRITSGSGRDPKAICTPIPQTCTWSLYGALSTVTGEPTAPAPIAVDGTRTVYAGTSTKLYAGSDSAYPGGFVFRWGSHETWLTSNACLVLPPGPARSRPPPRTRARMPRSSPPRAAATWPPAPPATSRSRTTSRRCARRRAWPTTR